MNPIYIGRALRIGQAVIGGVLAAMEVANIVRIFRTRQISE